jgi:hypothetical protein
MERMLNKNNKVKKQGEIVCNDLVINSIESKKQEGNKEVLFEKSFLAKKYCKSII